MSSSARICLIAEGFLLDLVKCVDSIIQFTKTPITILVNGKQPTIELDSLSGNPQINRKEIKNPLGWGNVVNQFLEQETDDVLIFMDPSTIFLADPIPATVSSFNNSVAAVGWKGGLIDTADEWRSVKDVGNGEVDVLFSYYMAVDRVFAKSTGGANASAKYYRNADLEFSLRLRAAGRKLFQLDLPLKQERHHGFHDVDPEYRDKMSRKNYQRILDNYRGRSEILSPRR
jgi:hypothetical protein